MIFFDLFREHNYQSSKARNHPSYSVINHGTLINLKKSLSNLLTDYQQKLEQRTELENQLCQNYQESNQLQQMIHNFSRQNSKQAEELQLMFQMNTKEVESKPE